MKIIFIYGYFGFDNLGDELILFSFLNLLNNYNYHQKFNVIISYQNLNSAFINNFKNFSNLNIKFIKRTKNPLSFKNIRIFLKSDFFVIPGGGIFQDYNFLSFFCYYFYVLVAKLFKLKTCLLFQSFTGINYKISKILIKIMINYFTDYINVRDYKSFKLIENICLRKLNNKSINDNLNNNFSDITWSLKNLFLNKNKLIKNKNDANIIVGISLRNWENISVQKFVDLIKTLNSNFKLKLQLYSLQKNYDCSLNEKIFSLLNNEQIEVEKINFTSDINYILKLISSCDICIGMRFHFNVLSLISNVPCIGLTYDEKVSELYFQLNLPDLCVDKSEFNQMFKINDYSLIVKKINYILNNYENICNKIYNFTKKMSANVKNEFNKFYYQILTN